MSDGSDPERGGRRRSLPNPLGRIVGAVVPNVMHAIDVDEVVTQIDVDALVARIDVNAFLARVDLDALVARVDIDAMVSRVDLDAMLAHVDLDALLARVDVDAVIDRVDIDHIVQRADLAGIVAQSTRGITANTVDMVRRQVVGLDELVTRFAARVARRDPDSDPDSPPDLRDEPVTQRRRTTGPSISGHYAGPLARTAAFAIDMTAMLFAFGLATALGSWTLDLILRRSGEYRLGPPWSTVLLVCWALLYFVIPLALTGRTVGKAVVGLRVVSRSGAPLRARQALARVVGLPFSFLLLGAGLLGAVFGRHRRTLHDLAAGSAEVIDWGDRAAALPSPINDWLERRRTTTDV